MTNQSKFKPQMLVTAAALALLAIGFSTSASSGHLEFILNEDRQAPSDSNQETASPQNDDQYPQNVAGHDLSNNVKTILTNHSIGAAAIGVLRGGELVDEIYFGDEQPGNRVDLNTQFEIASITKTVIAETALRLVQKGVLHLDEPLSPYWVDPDLVDDPRHRELTARLILTHRTGFPNWRFFREDGLLAFEHDPGTQYGYSGEGFNYLGRAIEGKLGKPLPQVVAEVLFDPLSMDSASIRNDPQFTENFAMLRTSDGAMFEKHCRPGFCFGKDDWNGAGLMTVTLRDFARFFAAVGRADGYPAEIAANRDRVQSIKTDGALVNCTISAPTPCPDQQGYGLGFEIALTGDNLIIGHGGFDFSTVSNAYINPGTGDGVIIFLTGPSQIGVQAMSELQNLVDPTSPFAARYREWAERARNRSD